ncbi:MAG: 30S ribosomal protein THX [Bacteroidia bacterium]|nr:30S ribosomal protein THX [Bacteroidia bacterium]MCZ2278456.1 30S ribosomal protein THX [Bacteroidia bacterium]
MGKGDKRSKKGKLTIGSFGKKRAARKQTKASLLRNRK